MYLNPNTEMHSSYIFMNLFEGCVYVICVHLCVHECEYACIYKLVSALNIASLLHYHCEYISSSLICTQLHSTVNPHVKDGHYLTCRLVSVIDRLLNLM